MGKYPCITHVIFDMDGLLLDTERLYTEATQNVVSKYGKNYPWELKAKIMGMRGDVTAKIITEDLEIPLTVPEYLEKVKEQYDILFPSSVLLPGADKLVRHLHKHNIPIAIASGGGQEGFDLKTTNHKAFLSLFHHVVLASTDPDVKAGKPNPDVFLVCLERFPDSPDPNKCLVFEDAPNGLLAGIAAGMQVVMVPDSRLDMSLTKGATEVLASLEDFQPQLYNLPAYESDDT